MMGMTKDQYRTFLAEREIEGGTIDPQSCELLRSYVIDCDPYGVLGVSPSDESVMIGSHWFVRALPDGGWVSEYDLPEATREATQPRKLPPGVTLS